MIVSPGILLKQAQKEGYAVPAFNFYNLDVLFAVLQAAEEEHAPVIVQLYSPYFSFLGYEVLTSAVLAALRVANISAALHMDHATEPELLKRAISSGFTSVMIDGSKLSLDENIFITKGIVAQAKKANVFTEGEIGRISRIGASDEQEDDLASVNECVRFVQESGVESLAPAVGTAHGIYVKPPKISFERIQQIHESTNVPLVLHGGSGIPDEMMKEAIRRGISKINVGTELKYCWSSSMREKLNAGELEPRIISAYAREQVKEIAKRKIRLFGASGKSTDVT